MGKIRSVLSEVSDISDVGMPDINGVFDIHEQMDSDLIKLVSNVNSYERKNVVRLENSVELLLENLQSCLSKIGLSQCAIESYETGSFITGKAADAIEGTQDIYYGSTGDIDSTAVNGIKDDLFQGNEDAYYLTENVFAFAASAMIPIGQASTAGNLTFKSTATIVAKEGISMGAGAGAQKITTDVTGNDTAGMVAGMVASGVTAKGLNGIEAEANKLAKAPKGIDGVTEGVGNLAEDVGKAGKGLEGAANGAESAAEDAGKIVETSYGKSSGKYDTTADFLTNIENRNGKFYTDKATIDKIGQVEARGEDFSPLNKRIMSSRASTEGGTSVVYKYSDELGTKYLIHEVTDSRGYIIHRDFDAVRISSGQLINKGH